MFVSDAVDCEYIETESSDTALLTVAYVMAGVCGLCLVPIFVLLAQASLKRRKHYHQLSGAREVVNDETSPSDFQNNNWKSVLSGIGYWDD